MSGTAMAPQKKRQKVLDEDKEKEDEDEEDEFSEPLPRYDYSFDANDAQKLRNVQGFLITCPFRREKSATVEANALLSRTRDNGEENPESEALSLSLVKLSCQGKLLLKIKPGTTTGTERAGKKVSVLCLLEKILDNISRGKVLPPKLCQKFFPIQALCSCDEVSNIQEAIRSILASTPDLFGFGGEECKPAGEATASKLTFAVASKPRCVKLRTGIKEDGKLAEVNVVNVLAKEFQNVFPKAAVDLKDPRVVILCESLQMSDNRTLLALCVTQKRLARIRSKGISIKALSSP